MAYTNTNSDKNLPWWKELFNSVESALEKAGNGLAMGSSVTGNTGGNYTSDAAIKAKKEKEKQLNDTLGADEFTPYYFKGRAGLKAGMIDRWNASYPELDKEAQQNALEETEEAYGQRTDDNREIFDEMYNRLYERNWGNRFKNSILANSKNERVKALYNNGNLTDEQWDNLDAEVAKLSQTEDIDGQTAEKEKNKAKSFFGDSLTLKDSAKDYLKSIDTSEEEMNLANQINQSQEAKKQAIDTIDELSNSLSTDYAMANNPDRYKELKNYDRLKDTECLRISDEEKVQLASKYFIDSKKGGEEYARENLVDYYKDKMEANQTKLDVAVEAGAQFLDSAASMLLGIGALIDGMATGGQIGKTIFGETEEEKQRRAGQSYWQNLFDNPMMEYSNDLMETHIYDKTAQKKMKELGVSDNTIYQTAEEENSVLNAKTPATLFGQYGFTAASTLASFGTTAAVQGTIKGGLWATKALGMTKNTQMWNKVLRAAANTKTALNLTNAGIIATAEGAQITQADKADRFHSMMEDMQNRYVESAVNNNPALAQSLLENRATDDRQNNIPTGTLVQGTDGNLYKTYSNNDKKQLASLIQSDSELKSQIVEAYMKAHPNETAQDEANIRKVAENAATTEFWLQSIVNGAANLTLQKTLLSKGMQNSLERAGKRLGLNTKKNPLEGVAHLERTSEGGWKAVANKATKTELVKERLKESVGEGLEEYWQDVMSGFGEGYNDSAYQQYIDAKYNDKNGVNSAFEYSIGEALTAGLVGGLEKTVDPTSIQDGIYGTLSTIMGGLNINQSFGDNQNVKGNWFERLSSKSPVTWRSVFTPFLNSTEARQRQSYNDQVVESLNKFLGDKKTQDMLFNTESALSFMRQYQNAIENKDEYEGRNAEFGQLFSVINQLNKLKGTAYYDAVMTSLDAREAVGEMTDEQLKEELQDKDSDAVKLLTEFKSTLDNKGKTPAETFDISPSNENVALLRKIAKNATDFKKVMADTEKQKAQVEKDFGGEVDDDGMAAIVYQQLAIKNAEERIAQINKELNEVQEASADLTDYKRAAAKHGTLKAISKKKEELSTFVTTIEEQLAEIGTKEQIETLLQKQQKGERLSPEETAKIQQYIPLVMAVEKAKQQRKVLEKEEKKMQKRAEQAEGDKTAENSLVLSAEEIMGLDASTRAYMLDPQNKSKYSAAQQKIIEELNNKGMMKYGKDWQKKLSDLARLESFKDTNLKEQNAIMESSAKLMQYVNTARLDKAVRLRETQYDPLFQNAMNSFDEDSNSAEAKEAQKNLSAFLAEKSEDPFIERAKSNLAKKYKNTAVMQHLINKEKRVSNIYTVLRKTQKYKELSDDEKDMLDGIAHLATQEDWDLEDADALLDTFNDVVQTSEDGLILTDALGNSLTQYSEAKTKLLTRVRNDRQKRKKTGDNEADVASLISKMREMVAEYKHDKAVEDATKAPIGNSEKGILGKVIEQSDSIAQQAEEYRKKWNHVNVGDKVNILTDGGPLKGEVIGYVEKTPVDGEPFAVSQEPSKYVAVRIEGGEYRFTDNPDSITKEDGSPATGTDNSTEIKTGEENNSDEGAINDIQQRLYSQIVSQFKDMGITVHDKAEMDKFLKEHGYENIQELAREYGKWHPYGNIRLTTKEQRDSLISQIQKKNYQENGTDVIKVGNFLFLVDVMPQEDLRGYYQDEVPDGRGYGIRNKYNIKDITKEDVEEIVRNIAIFYGYNYQRINHVLQSAGIEPRYLSESIITSAYPKAERNVASGNVGTFGLSGEQQRERDSENTDSRDRSKNQGGNRKGELIQAYIGKKARLSYRDILRKHRPDLTDLQIEEILNFLHSLQESKENTAFIKTAVKWVANKSIALPRDKEIAQQLFDRARKYNIDLSKYKTMGEVIASPEYRAKREKDKPVFDPDKAKTFHNKHIVTTEGGRTFTVYDVDDTEEGQKEVCHALAAHYKVSPWCLATFTGTGKPTESAKKYWNQYNALGRKIAYENGKPVAFYSNNNNAQKTLKGHRLFKTPYYTEVVNLKESKDLEELQKQGLVRLYDENDDKSFWILTDKGEKEVEETSVPGWWDLEDRKAQLQLSDNISTNEERLNLAARAPGPESFEAQVEETEYNVESDIEYELLGREAEERADEIVSGIHSRDEYLQFLHDHAEDFDRFERLYETGTLEVDDPESILQMARVRLERIYERDEIQELRISRPQKNKPTDIEERIGISSSLSGTGDVFVFGKKGSNVHKGQVDGRIKGRNRPNEVVFYVSNGMQQAAFHDPKSSREGAINITFWRNLTEQEKQEISDILPKILKDGKHSTYADIAKDIDNILNGNEQGELYGFAYKGEIYLDETKMSPDVALHEYTHLWDRAVMHENPELWDRGKELMRQLDLWKDMEESESYGKKWREQGRTEQEIEDLIASEVHARLVGPDGERILNELAEKQGADNIVDKLKQWLLETWESLLDTFQSWNHEQLEALTLEDFTKMTLRDFVNGINPNITKNSVNEADTEISDYNLEGEQYGKDVSVTASNIQGMNLQSIMDNQDSALQPLRDFITRYNILNYLSTHSSELLSSPKPKIYFARLSELDGYEQSLKNSYGSRYDEAANMPIVALIEIPAGQEEEFFITLTKEDGTQGKFQPVSVLPSTANPNYRGSANLNAIRNKYVKKDALITDNMGKPLSVVMFRIPSHSIHSDTNTTLEEAIFNTVIQQHDKKSETVKRTTEGGYTRAKRRGKLNKIRDKFLSRLRLTGDNVLTIGIDSNKPVDANDKWQQVEVYVTPMSRVTLDNGQLFTEALQEGNTDVLDICVLKNLRVKLKQTYWNKIHQNNTQKYIEKTFKEHLYPATTASVQWRVTVDDDLNVHIALTQKNTVLTSFNMGANPMEILSDDAKMITMLKTLLLDTNGKVQQIKTFSGENAEAVHFQVDFLKLGAASFSCSPTQYLKDIVDDGLLEVSRDSLLYTSRGTEFSGVRAVTTSGSSPVETTEQTTGIATTNGDIVDAITGVKYENEDKEETLIEEGLTDKEAEERADAIVKEIQKTSSQFSDPGNEDHYTRVGDIRYERVTSICRENVDIPPQLKLVSTSLGNTVDELGRDFFAGDLVEVEVQNVDSEGNTVKTKEYKLKKGKELLSLSKQYPNMKEEALQKIARQFALLQQAHPTWKFYSHDIKAFGTKTWTDSVTGEKRTSQIAGTLDLLVYDKERHKFLIIDMKTSHTQRINQNTWDGYRKQVTLYKDLLEQQYGEKGMLFDEESPLYLLHIDINYDSPSQTLSYEAGAKPNSLMFSTPKRKGLPVKLSEKYIGNLALEPINPLSIEAVSVTSTQTFNTEATDTSIVTVKKEKSEGAVRGEGIVETAVISLKGKENTGSIVLRKNSNSDLYTVEFRLRTDISENSDLIVITKEDQKKLFRQARAVLPKGAWFTLNTNNASNTNNGIVKNQDLQKLNEFAEGLHRIGNKSITIGYEYSLQPNSSMPIYTNIDEKSKTEKSVSGKESISDVEHLVDSKEKASVKAEDKNLNYTQNEEKGKGKEEKTGGTTEKKSDKIIFEQILGEADSLVFRVILDSEGHVTVQQKGEFANVWGSLMNEDSLLDATGKTKDEIRQLYAPARTILNISPQATQRQKEFIIQRAVFETNYSIMDGDKELSREEFEKALKETKMSYAEFLELSDQNKQLKLSCLGLSFKKR